MIVSNKSTSVSKEARERLTLRERIKYALAKLKRKRKVKGEGKIEKKSLGWSEEELREIIHMIGKRCPGVTRISVTASSVYVEFECSPDEFLNKNKKNILKNPSRGLKDEMP